MISSIARELGLGEADADDVEQAVWLRLVQHIGRIRQPERLRGWLATTTRNECARMWRQRRRVTSAAPETFDQITYDSGAEPEVETNDRDIQIRAAAATLTRRQQAVIWLLMSDPRPSYVEIGSCLGIPVGSIGPTRERSLRALHTMCVDLGVEPG